MASDTFTTKAGALYAIVLGTPSGQVRIASLGAKRQTSSPAIASVRVLGQDAPLQWRQEADALVIDVPARMATDHASVLKIVFVL